MVQASSRSTSQDYLVGMSVRADVDRWGFTAPNILSPERLSLIRETMEESCIIVEHWYYRGSRGPGRLVFDDYDAFEEYLHKESRPGDSIWIWRFDALCRVDNALAQGKYPDTDGMVPERGAY
jgi:hypothetical protein